MRTIISAALAALVFAVVPACSGGDGGSGGGGSSKVKANKLAQLDPAEARQRIMQTGYPVNADGLRTAVDYLDADSVALFIAAGLNVDDMAGALSWPVEGTQRYHNPKFPAQLENYIDDPSYRSILATMFDAGLTPNDALVGIGPSQYASRYTTSLFAESLRIGNEDFINFLRSYNSDWNEKPGCYQKQTGCDNPGSLASFLFYAGTRTELWPLDTALQAYDRFRALGIEPVSSGEDADPYLMAVLAYQKHFWSPDSPEIDALWQEVGSPRPILPYGKSIEEEARLTNPDKVMFTIEGSQREYLTDKVFPCIAANGDDYYACLESPPAE